MKFLRVAPSRCVFSAVAAALCCSACATAQVGESGDDTAAAVSGHDPSQAEDADTAPADSAAPKDGEAATDSAQSGQPASRVEAAGRAPRADAEEQMAQSVSEPQAPRAADADEPGSPAGADSSLSAALDEQPTSSKATRPQDPLPANTAAGHGTAFAPQATLDAAPSSGVLGSCDAASSGTHCGGLSWVEVVGANGSAGSSAIMVFHDGQHVGTHDHEQGVDPVVRRIDDTALTITRRIPTLASGQAEGRVVTRLEWDAVEQTLYEQTTSTVARVGDSFAPHP